MKKKITRIFCAAFVGVAAFVGGLLLNPVETSAATISSTVFQTDGASVRVFEKLENGYESTEKQGIRFHVEMGADYAVNGKTLLDTKTKNANGSYKLAEGYKTYTIVLPTRLLPNDGELTIDTPRIMKIETSNYWFSDADGNWESVAYIYNIPQNRYTDEFSFRGIICSVDEEGNETVVKSTETSERSLTYVAKRAYEDTIDESYNYWGTKELDEQAAPLIKAFIPSYTVDYGNGKTETVLWGDTLKNADASKHYYDETNDRTVDVDQPLTFAESCSIRLTETEEHAFVLTGVDYTADGFKVYATLPTQYFADGTELSPNAIVMQTSDGKSVSAKSVKVSVQGEGNDAVNMLVMTFDYTDISNGTQLTISNDSNFYHDGVLYRLESDYTFTYENANWSLPLGTISHGDIQYIQNFAETNSKGETEHNVRIAFYKDFLINGDVAFDGSVTITRANGGNVETISDGAYYWNQGSDKILELDHANKIWGETDGDVLKITKGTKLIQHNGYYVFSDDIEATYNGKGDWYFTTLETKIDASSFTTTMYTYESDSDGTYVDLKTKTSWVEAYANVVVNDGTIVYTPLNGNAYTAAKVSYHGENGANMLRISVDAFSKTGDTFKLPKGIEFWIGNKIFTLTEDLEFYCVKTPTQTRWVLNPKIENVGSSNIQTMNWYKDNDNKYGFRYITTKAWSAADGNNVYVDATGADGKGVVCDGTNYERLFYYGGANSVLEIYGVDFATSGGSITIQKGTKLWLFNASYDYAPVGAYLFTEDVKVVIKGATSTTTPAYKDEEVGTISASDVLSVANYSDNNEIRFTLNHKNFTYYGAAALEGSATLDGTSATDAFVYGYNNGYTGNNIFALRGVQATQKGQKVVVAAGTKLWLSDASGYITIQDELSYIFNGTNYTSSDMQYSVSFNVKNAMVQVNGTNVTSASVKVGEKLTFTVTPNAGYTLYGVSGATLVSGSTYVTDSLYGSLNIDVVAVKRIELSSDKVTKVEWYTGEGSEEIRMYLDQNNISELTNIAGQGAMNADKATVSGALGTPSKYTYYGVVAGTGHQIFGITLTNTALQAGNAFTVAKGSSFVYGEYEFCFTEDVTVEYITINATFDASLNTLYIDNKSCNDGDAILQLSGATHTIAIGWTSANLDKKYYLSSMTINGAEKGTKGTYTDIKAKDGTITIEAKTVKRKFSVTWNVQHVNLSVKLNGNMLNSGDEVECDTEIEIWCTVSVGWEVTSVTVNGNTPANKDGAKEVYTYTVQSDTTISVTTTEQDSATIANGMLYNYDTGNMSLSTNSDGATVIESKVAQTTVGFGLSKEWVDAAIEQGYTTLTITVKAEKTWGTSVSSINTTVGNMGDVKNQTATLTINLKENTDLTSACLSTNGQYYQITLTAKNWAGEKFSNWTLTIGDLSK